MREVGEVIRELTLDQEGMLIKCERKSELIVQVAREVNWARLCGGVIDLGFRVLNISAHGKGKRHCS